MYSEREFQNKVLSNILYPTKLLYMPTFVISVMITPLLSEASTGHRATLQGLRH